MSTPVRLDDTLVRQAAAESALNHRSTPKQIELWAELGRLIASKVSADDLLALTQGLMTLRTERIASQPVETDQLWSRLEADRNSGKLATEIQRDRTVYQAHPDHPGYLEEIRPNGRRRTGRFHNGAFTEVKRAETAA